MYTGKSFEMDDDEIARIKDWYEELKPRILEAMKEKGVNPANYNNEPYYGAISGGLTYSFVPTGLGVILTVREYYTGEELLVTDFDRW